VKIAQGRKWLCKNHKANSSTPHLRLFEIARVLVRLDHVARFIGE